jgi:L-amino acid N-acyltransferase YncA
MYVIAALVESDNPASLALFRKAGYVDPALRGQRLQGSTT